MCLILKAFVNEYVHELMQLFPSITVFKNTVYVYFVYGNIKLCFPVFVDSASAQDAGKNDDLLF